MRTNDSNSPNAGQQKTRRLSRGDRFIKWVSEADVSPTDKAVMNALASYVGIKSERADGTFLVWPGKDAIAKRAGTTSRTVFTSLKRLERLGYIARSIRHKDGYRESHEYSLRKVPPAEIPCGKLERAQQSPSENLSDGHEKIFPTPSEDTSDEGVSVKGEHLEGTLTSGAEAPHKKQEFLPQEQKKEKSGGGITALQLIARAEKADTVAGKFPTAGTDYEARWGLLCELTKELHPEIAPLIGTGHFLKLIRPLDRFAKGMAKDGKPEAVPRALGEFFALSTGFPELPAHVSHYCPDSTASQVHNVLMVISDGIADGSLENAHVPHHFRITPLDGQQVSIMEVQ